MAYAYITPENKIRKIVVKLSPFERVLPGERIATYNEPKYDPGVHIVLPVEPVTGNEVQFTITESPQALQTITAKKTQLVQNYLDSKAQERGYDSILSAVSYAVYPKSPFYAEGVAYADWRSKCWVTLFDILDKVASNIMSMPEDAELLAMLPKLGETY